MKNLKRIVSVLILITLSAIGVDAQTQRRPRRISDRQVANTLTRVEQDSQKFRNSLDSALDRSRRDGTRAEDDINSFASDFDNSVDQLRERFNGRRSVAADVQSVLQKATLINEFMGRNRLNAQTQNNWAAVRSDLNELANAYGVNWQWNQQTIPAATSGSGLYSGGNRLTGTFRLDASSSDNPRDVANRATRNLRNSDRQRVYDYLLARLEGPESLSIDRRGSTVTIASSRAPESTFEADGRARQEQLPNGTQARVTATLRGEQLVINSSGTRENGFSITFDPLESGRRLRVTRQIYADGQSQPVVVQSVYDRTSDVAQGSVYNGSGTYSANAGSTNGDLIVPNGERIVAVLNTGLNTRQAKAGDRFTMIVRQPGQYESAVIEGTVASIDRGGRISGRSAMSLNFDTIRLRDGQSYRFAGIIEEVRTPNGETVQVDNEGGVAESDSRTQQTIQRGAIGTAIGAIIGAIAGGGKGAAIGAVVGAAGGAGSVYVQGQDDVELLSGSEVTIRASAPIR